EQQCHEHPAAADAIAAVAHAQPERAGDVGTKSAVALDEEPGRLALAQADVLEGRPLINAGGNQHHATEDIARSLVGVSKALRSIAHCAAVAARAKPTQVTRHRPRRAKA